MDPTRPNQIETAAELSRRATGIEEAHKRLSSREAADPAGTLVALPATTKIEDLHEKLALGPRRVEEVGKLQTPDSLIAYFNRHKTPDSILLLDLASRSFTGIIDYHRIERGQNPAAWCKHRAEFKPRPTLEWTAWKSYHKKWISQADFAEFVEENISDVAEPDAGTMLAICNSFQVKTAVNFEQGVITQSGQVNLIYNETIAGVLGSGQIAVPTEFVLALAPFEGGPKYRLKVRFRFRVKDRQLSLGYAIDRPEKAEEDAVKDLADKIGSGVGLPLWIGTI